MIVKNGNILNCTEFAIVQQVNCQNRMGSGLAKVIHTKWPIVKSNYHTLCNITSDPQHLLGHVQPVNVGSKIIYNAFSQFDYGRDGRCYTNYDAVDICFKQILFRMNQNGIDEVAIPYMYGCGLGGGDWNIVYDIIDGILKDHAIFYKLP